MATRLKEFRSKSFRPKKISKLPSNSESKWKNNCTR